MDNLEEVLNDYRLYMDRFAKEVDPGSPGATNIRMMASEPAKIISAMTKAREVDAQHGKTYTLEQVERIVWCALQAALEGGNIAQAARLVEKKVRKKKLRDKAGNYPKYVTSVLDNMVR